MKLTGFAPLAIAAGMTLQPSPADAYDMDCAIMLCMAGGFPPSAVCSAAYAEMIRRITPWPSLPPFGVCTYAAAPAELGGPGKRGTLDISTPDYLWLRRTRIIWWSGRSYRERGGPLLWSWFAKSCEHDNANCRVLVARYGSPSPWPDTITTENGQVVATPGAGSGEAQITRAVAAEYGDYRGNLTHSDWIRY